MVSEVQSESVVQQFHVRFRDGIVWVIPAVRFIRQVEPEDLVRFYDANNVEDTRYFLRGDDVSAIGPEANLEYTPLVLELIHSVQSLAERMDTLDNNLIETITQAINAALAAHGM